LYVVRRYLNRHRWPGLLSALLILMGSGVFSLSRMNCLMSGRTTLAYGLLEDCCLDVTDPSEASVSPVCCLYSEVGSDGLEQRQERALRLVPDLIVVGHLPRWSSDAVARRTRLCCATGPPPERGAQRQARLRRLLI
jgi:hypothetical protein